MLYIGGTRTAGDDELNAVEHLVFNLSAKDETIAVGCCVGVDQAAMDYAYRLAYPHFKIFAIFDAQGRGACSLSALSSVFTFHAANPYATVFLAGGTLNVPLHARLARRTQAAIRFVHQSQELRNALFVFGSPEVGGTFKAACFAASLGLPVVGFFPSFDPAIMPALGVGRWSPAPYWSKQAACPAAAWCPDANQPTLL